MLLPPSPPAPTCMQDLPVAKNSAFAEEELANGLHLRFFDQSNRYFGDYHRLYIVVEITVILSAEFIPDPELLATAVRRFGDRLVTTRTLERMGVPGDQLATLRKELLASYRLEVDKYLSRPGVPLSLLRSGLARQASPSNVLRLR